MTVADTSVWLDPADGRRWRFDPGSLSLAFAYTGDFGFGVPAWERLSSPVDLDEWLTERFGPLRGPADDADHADALQLRTAIVSCARRAAAGQLLVPTDVDVINDWARRSPISPHLNGGTRPAEAPRAAQTLATIAQDAATTLTHAADRFRECDADDCRLIFLDTSRPRARRWCSMSRCGGRAKAHTHYARHTLGAQ